MNPGKMDRRITIEARTLGKDSAGGRTETWETAAEVWAELVTRKSRESAAADSERPMDTRTFRIRYRSITEHNHRLTYDVKTFNITGISEEGRKQTLLIEATAATAIPA